MKKHIGVDKDAHWFKVIDLDTGKEIKGCIGADDETGEYYAYVIKKEFEHGYEIEHDIDGEPNTEFKKGNIKLVDTRLEE